MTGHRGMQHVAVHVLVCGQAWTVQLAIIQAALRARSVLTGLSTHARFVVLHA